MGVGWRDYLRLRMTKGFVYTARVRDCTIRVKVGSLLELWRCKTYESKEPETLDWIETFSRGDVMFDVGANVGLYSLYAGVRGARVFSFEPEAQNFASLTANLFQNRLDNASCYCLALSDKEHFGSLFVTGATPGDSQHNLDSENPFYARSYTGKQGCFSTTLDQLCFNFGLPVPNHIKIDVDGIEPEILLGSEAVVRHSSFKSMLVEVNALDDRPAKTLEVAQRMGLRVASKAEREYRSGAMWGRNFVLVPAGNVA